MGNTSSSSRCINDNADQKRTGEKSSNQPDSSPTESRKALIGVTATGQQLRELPGAFITYAAMASSLDVSNNRLSHLPSDLAQLKYLERLSLGSNLLLSLPDNIGQLKQLRWMDATHNRLSMLPDSFGELQEMAALGLSDCSFAVFPQSLTHLTKMRKLGMFNNAITTIPREIGRLQCLEKLDLSGNRLQTVPEEIGCLTCLVWLNLSGNRLESLPASLSRLSKLQELGLCHNRLRSLPDLSSFQDLKVCSIYGNAIADLACANLECCGALVKLDVSSNQLTSIPPKIFSLPLLEYLNIRENPLTQIAAGTRTGRQLAKLDIQNCCLRSIPASLLSRSDALQIRASGNPFSLQPVPNYSIPPLLQMVVCKGVAMNCWPRQEHLWCWWWLGEGKVTACAMCGEPFTWRPGIQQEVRQSDDQVEMVVDLEVCSAACFHSIKSSRQILTKS